MKERLYTNVFTQQSKFGKLVTKPGICQGNKAFIEIVGTDASGRPHSCLSYIINILLGFVFFVYTTDIF